MKKQMVFFLIAAASIGTSGCERIEGLVGGNSPDAGPVSIQDAIRQRFDAKLDSSMTREERDQLASDLSADLNYQIHPVDGSPYAQVFGSTDTGSTLSYLDERIKFVFPSSARLQAVTLRQRQHQHDDQSNSDTVQMVAQNLSAPLWFTQLQHPERPLLFLFQQNIGVHPESTRVGVIQLGGAYMASARPHDGHDAAGPAFRMATLIHEARHSDCKDGIGPEDLARIRRGEEPRNHQCSFMHSICGATIPGPDGQPLRNQRGQVIHNPYEGYPACDPFPWGAYGVEAVYVGAIARTCANCTEQEKQEALMDAGDAAMRLASIFPAMMRGELGAPDMTSKGLVNADGTPADGTGTGTGGGGTR